MLASAPESVNMKLQLGQFGGALGKYIELVINDVTWADNYRFGPCNHTSCPMHQPQQSKAWCGAEWAIPRRSTTFSISATNRTIPRGDPGLGSSSSPLATDQTTSWTMQATTSGITPTIATHGAMLSRYGCQGARGGSVWRRRGHPEGKFRDGARRFTASLWCSVGRWRWTRTMMLLPANIGPVPFSPSRYAQFTL